MKHTKLNKVVLKVRSYRLPKLGWRTIKTAISIFACIALYYLLDREQPIFACVVAIICMQSSIANTITISVDRMIGTILGGVTGVVMAAIYVKIPYTQYLDSVLIPLGIIIAIYLCNIVKRPGGATVSCMLVLYILLNLQPAEYFEYSFDRMIDTFIGILVAFIINKYIKPNNSSQI